ncbi:MAG: glycosyl transferase [Rhodobacteraceae bacterium]|uniref:glycosyl transferase n=1 Tax=Amaricoccus sp. B4 TaxID=3368557 RepID=UPI000DACCDF8|nr:glycosyl transferase [Paracoccaceae bacterium]
MADFHQNGFVATLHNLRATDPEMLTAQLEGFARTRKITLILPSLYSELEGEALPHIVEELAGASYLNKIVIGLDRADAAQYRHAKAFFSRLPQDHAVLWNDGPRLREIDARMEQIGLAPEEPGKGRNVWYCMGYALACQDSSVIALHDCDITTYSRHMLARLVYPVANPNFPYQLCKGYYPRIADGKLNGRVNRLLVGPLLIALKKVVGDREYFDYLRAFRYPLAGEFAMRTAIVPDMRIPSDWGLEIGVLSEAWRNLNPRSICQVDISDAYDHKHQPVSAEDRGQGLSRMSVDICKALYRKLAGEGVVFSQETFTSLKATYHRIALDMIESYYADAMLNGLHLDRHQEESNVELFASNVVEAGNVYLENPMETPFIPSWSRVYSADPDIMRQMRDAVAEDNAEHG